MMRKNFVFIFGIIFIFTTLLYSENKTVTLPLKDYKQLLKKLEQLEKRVETLEKETPEKINKVEKQVKKVKEDMNDVYDTMDEVETKTLRDRVNISGEIRTRVDNYRIDAGQRFDYKAYSNDMMKAMMGIPGFDKTGAKYFHKEKIKNNNAWSNRLRLNLDADIMKNLKFHGRMTMYKNWSDSDKIAVYADPNRSKTPSDTAVRFERAYIDWIIPNKFVPIAVTIGRQPSSEGPPFEFKENKKRLATYPALLFDGEADGVVITLGLEKWTGIKNNAFRFAYGEGYQSDDDFTPYYDERGGLDDLNVLGFFFEGEIPGLDNSLFVLSYVRGFDFVDNPLNANMNLGDMDLFGVHLQAPKFLNSDFDIFLSTGMNVSHPNNKFFPASPMTMFMTGGLLDDDGRNSHTGYAVYTGFRYNIPWKALNNPKFGFEYNHGSRYWFSFTQGSTELFNKLATRGNAYDFYYIQPINKFLFFRFGYTYIDYNYNLSGWHIGKPQPIDDILRNLYFLVDCRF